MAGATSLVEPRDNKVPQKKGGNAFLYLMRVSTQPDNVFVHFASLTCLECTLLWVHFKDDEWAGVNHTALWFECSNGGVRMWISNFNIYICRVKADKSIKTQKKGVISQIDCNPSMHLVILFLGVSIITLWSDQLDFGLENTGDTNYTLTVEEITDPQRHSSPPTIQVTLHWHYK